MEDEKLEKLTIRISKEKKEELKKLVEKSSYNSISELARAGIDKELNIQIYKDVKFGLPMPKVGGDVLWVILKEKLKF